MEVKVNGLYRHFKGGFYKVDCIAQHTETDEPMVVYTSLETGLIWTRPLSMFTSKTDKEKYPNAQQEYRFELIDED